MSVTPRLQAKSMLHPEPWVPDPAVPTGRRLPAAAVPGDPGTVRRGGMRRPRPGQHVVREIKDGGGIKGPVIYPFQKDAVLFSSLK